MLHTCLLTHWVNCHVVSVKTENIGKVYRFNVHTVLKGTRENTGRSWTWKEKKKYTVIWYKGKYPLFQSIPAKKRQKITAFEDTVWEPTERKKEEC